MLQCGLLRLNFSLAIRVLPAVVERIHKRDVERVAGIEPASSAWKAAALPLCYTRQGRTGSSSPSVPIPTRGGGSRTRTCEGFRQRIYSPPPLPLGTFPQRAR